MTIAQQNEKVFGKTMEKLRSISDQFTVQLAQTQAPLREAYEELESLSCAVEEKQSELEELASKETILQEIAELQASRAELKRRLEAEREEVDYQIKSYSLKVKSEAQQEDIVRDIELSAQDRELSRREEELAKREAEIESDKSTIEGRLRRQFEAVFSKKEAEYKLEHEGDKVRSKMLESENVSLKTEVEMLRSKLTDMVEKTLEAQSGQAALAAAQSMAATVNKK